MTLRAQRDPWFVAAFVVLALATCLPIWIGRYLPLLDVPNHLSAIAVWHYYDDPRFDFQRFYELHLVPLPYWAHYFTVHVLTYAVGSIETANKIFLTAYALALPLGAVVFARRFGRSVWLALFTFPIVWNFDLADGFIAYCAGFAAVPFALVLVDRHAEHPRWQTAFAVIVVGSLVYFFHLLPYVLFLIAGGVLVLSHRERFLWLLLPRGLPVLACAGIGIWAMRHAESMRFHPLVGKGYQLDYDPLVSTLSQIPHRLLSFLPGQVDELVVVVLLVCWLGLVVTAATSDDNDEGRGHGWGVELCMAVALFLFLVTPRSMHRPFYWHMINGRFVVALVFFAALCVRGAIRGWRRLFLAPVFVVCLVYVFALCSAFVEFNEHAVGLDDIVAQVPRGEQVLTLVCKPMNDPTVNVSAFNEFPSYVQLLHGGYNFYNFSEGFPLVYKKHLPAPLWSRPYEFDWARHSSGWGWFITFREGREDTPMKRPLEEHQVQLVDQRGEWRLYKNLHPDPQSP